MEKNEVYGYVYDDKGMHSHPVVLEDTVENIAVFIGRGLMAPRIMITDKGDNLILDAMHGFINTCTDQSCLGRLTHELMHYQMGISDPFEKELKWTSCTYNEISKEECEELLCNELEEHFDYKLR